MSVPLVPMMSNPPKIGELSAGCEIQICTGSRLLQMTSTQHSRPLSRSLKIHSNKSARIRFVGLGKLREAGSARASLPIAVAGRTPIYGRGSNYGWGGWSYSLIRPLCPALASSTRLASPALLFWGCLFRAPPPSHSSDDFSDHTGAAAS